MAISTTALLTAAFVMVWLTNHRESGTESPVELSHVHGMEVNPGDLRLYVAAHEGLFVLDEDGTVARVGQGGQDLMGFTVAGPDHFLASGHPAPGEDGPSPLGLIESTDAGVTWEPVSLPGEADFHVLRYAHGMVYGLDSVSGQLLVSEDLVDWEPRGSEPIVDFAVNPADPESLVATGPSGTLGSSDGGRTWAPIASEPMVLLYWTNSGLLWGVGPDGEIYDNYDEGVTWRFSVGAAEATPAALVGVGDKVVLATDDGRILVGDEWGRNWREAHVPGSLPSLKDRRSWPEEALAQTEYLSGGAQAHGGEEAAAVVELGQEAPGGLDRPRLCLGRNGSVAGDLRAPNYYHI